MTRSRRGAPLGDVALEEWAGAFDSPGGGGLPPEVGEGAPTGVADELDGQGGLLTVDEAARSVGVSRVVVRSWIYRGQVVAVPDGPRRWLIGEQSLYDCELARRNAPGWDDEARARRGGDDESP